MASLRKFASVSAPLFGRHSALCTVSELQTLLGSSEHPILLDASWHLDPAKDGRADFSRSRIPGAQYFDINEVADNTSANIHSLPHMFPPPGVQRAAISHFGLDGAQPIVVYETGGLFAAPRAWWTLKHMGFDAYILSGGLSAWLAAGGKVDSEPMLPQPVSASGHTPSDWSPPPGVVSFDGMQDLSAKAAAAAENMYILDARSSGRFDGTSPEPRPGIPSGHMPGSINVPFSSLVDSQGQLLPPDQLREVFTAAKVKVDDANQYITTCGSGVTAAVVLLALHECGVSWQNLKLFDGSWLEWASRGGKIE